MTVQKRAPRKKHPLADEAKAKNAPILVGIDKEQPPAVKKTGIQRCDDFGLDEIIYRVKQAITLRDIAVEIGVAHSVLHGWISATDERTRAYTVALGDAGDRYAELAEQILLEAPATKEEIARARALAEHYRWMAKVRNRKVYGDKQEIETTDKTPPKEVVDARIEALQNTARARAEKARKGPSAA